nr:ATP-dependent DNA helicase PIF1-like [Tanacetum cinerariifolium]
TIVMFDDETAEVVVVMFDETKRVLLKCSASSILDYEGQIYFSAPFHFMNMFTDLRMHDEEAYLGLPIALANIVGISHTLELKSHMYYEHGNYESFTCWKVVKGEDVEEGASSATVAANDASKASKLKRLSKPLAVATPSKLGEEKKQRREDLEDSDAKASFVADSQPKGEDVAYSSNKRKIKRNRLGAFIDQDIGDGEDGTIMGSLIKMLDQNSTIAKAFRMEKDWCHSHTSVNVDLRMLSERTNSRQYNAPTVAEVAALFTNNFRDGKPTRDIVVNKKDSGPKRISELHPSYMAFKYPLLFSYGEDGGARTFVELITVNKILCTTFKEACFAYGLLNDDREWTRAIHEATLWALGPQIRDLIITILLFCDGLLPCSYQLEGLLTILPVIPKGKRADIVQACINCSVPWKHCKVFTITQSMRVNEYYANEEIDTQKQDFNQWVLAVGDGKLHAEIKDGEDKPTWIEIPKKFLINSSNSPTEHIVAETYLFFIERQRDNAYLKKEKS